MRAAAMFSFTTNGGQLTVGSVITLMFPSGFFATTSMPLVAISGNAAGGAAAPSATYIGITISSGTLAVGTAVTVTLTGLTMGASTAGNSIGITILTSADTTASVGVASGTIGGRVTNPSFTIASVDRVAGKSSAAATFAFTSTAGGALAPNGKITLIYPSNFFATSTTPTVAMSGGITGTAAAPTSNYIIITTATATLGSSAAVTVTLLGLTMGPTNNGTVGVHIRTSSDVSSTAAIAPGQIGSQNITKQAITAIEYGVVYNCDP